MFEGDVQVAFYEQLEDTAEREGIELNALLLRLMRERGGGE